MAQTLVKIRSSELRKKKSNAEAAPVAGPKPTKTDLIRSFPASLSPAEIVAEAKKRGVALSANLVSLVRGRDRRNPGPPRRRGRPRKNAQPATHVNGTAGAPVRAVAALAASAKKKALRDAPLTARERELASILVEIGLDRVLALVDQLKRALDAV